MSSLDIVVSHSKNQHRAIDQAGPIHLLHRWIRVAREEGEDEGESEEEEAEPVQQEPDQPRECEFGREEGLVVQSPPEETANRDNVGGQNGDEGERSDVIQRNR